MGLMQESTGRWPVLSCANPMCQSNGRGGRVPSRRGFYQAGTMASLNFSRMKRFTSSFW